MRRPARLVIGFLTLLLGVTLTHARTPQVTAMTFSGWVQVREALDQRTTVVTVVVGATQAAPTDIVSVAFRLQHAPQAFVEYAGPATVLYSRSRLTVAEPYRVCRRAHSLRGWVYGTTNEVFTGGPRAGRPDGAGAWPGAPVAVGGDGGDRPEAGVHDGNAPPMGPAG